MTKFEKGDNIIIYKPTNTEQYPRWDCAMNQFNGRVSTFLRYDSEGNILIEEDIAWSFHPDWCEKIESIPSVSLEDLGSFPNGFSGNPVYNHIKASTLSPQALSTEIDWEQRRYELIKAYIATIDATTPYIKIPSTLISLADETIKQLKQQ